MVHTNLLMISRLLQIINNLMDPDDQLRSPDPECHMRHGKIGGVCCFLLTYFL
jgi:hypothetical protein